MDKATFDLMKKLMEVTHDIGEIKGELKAVKEENEHLRALVKKHIESTEA